MPHSSGVLNGRGFLPSKFDSLLTPPGMTRTHHVGWSFYRSNWGFSILIDFSGLLLLSDSFGPISASGLPLGDPRGGGSTGAMLISELRNGPLEAARSFSCRMASQISLRWTVTASGARIPKGLVAADIDDGDFNVVTKHDGPSRC